ncbi:PREDICTED: RING-H2 finger protein ATL78 [Tarenaya hassleriana]|uniref:RING-H2 finger protein ATL78 n=1 Tax=Tarenaya hassleriana TaxID=28532 RepID=UPI00053C801D|nr:PREDICTED: RING-H2 finger protein ATL78 [Tarenaya hassleriana]
MSTSTSASTTQQALLFQDIIGSSYPRRLLLQTLYQPPTSAPPSPVNAHEAYTGDNSFDANVVMVLSVLLCALVCSLGLNSIIKCALRCSNLVSSEASGNQAVRLANTGVKRKALKSFQTVNYSTELKLPGLDTECAICLSEFAPRERVKLLPKCNHGFHVRCIDKWLGSHSSCPTCRHCLIETCQKIAGCSQASSSESSQPPQDSIVQITPLEPERLIHGFR